MTRLTIRNKQPNPTTAHTLDQGSKTIDPGQSLTAEFSDAEANNIRANVAVFDVTEHGDDGHAVKNAGTVAETEELAKARALYASLAPLAGRLQAATPDELTGLVTVKLDELDAANQVIADILAMFPGETIKPADLPAFLTREYQRYGDNETSAANFEQKVRSALGIGEGVGILETIEALKSGSANQGGKLTLAAAVASLDDAKADDWTQSGLPSIERLKALTGQEITRHEVDALVPPRTRKS